MIKMELKDNIEVEKVDILMYHGIYNLAINKMRKLNEELIPTFMIEEALSYFSNLEKYEMCQKIKEYFLKHQEYTIKSSRMEWYGIPVKKKQKS